MSDDVSDALFTVEELDLAILFPFALLAFPELGAVDSETTPPF